MFTLRSLLVKNRAMMLMPKSYNKFSSVFFKRNFSTSGEVQQVEDEQALEHMTEEERLIFESKKFGADLAFNNRKHGYILSFPWNFEEIIRDYEQDFTPLAEGDFWHRWIFNRE